MTRYNGTSKLDTCEIQSDTEYGGRWQEGAEKKHVAGNVTILNSWRLNRNWILSLNFLTILGEFYIFIVRFY